MLSSFSARSMLVLFWSTSVWMASCSSWLYKQRKDENLRETRRFQQLRVKLKLLTPPPGASAETSPNRSRGPV